MTPSDDNSAPVSNLTAAEPNPAERRAIARTAMRRCWLLAGGMIAATGLGLAACTSAPPPVATPGPAPTPSPAPAPAPLPVPADWRDAPLTQGDWHYVSDARASRALFGPANSEARFIVACEPATRQVKLWRTTNPNTTASEASPAMSVTTTEAARTLTTERSGGTLPQIVAALAPHDPILDAMVFTRGRFMVQVQGTETLYLPSWPEIARVVEDCR
ncbi:hypothetical protein [Croceicoccus sp. BE223]|uniref:hypothetical protein n=1 Tax=Croceicoccus sp. BE223 TaxID=2817716 RepID=UPI002863B652|nr:hypothetical protein [Croceicoccus sp. BE223]MDR7103589.1 hypothetical protein [Croceicoccus sp. BE223]